MTLWEESLVGGATWSHILKRGTSLRITDTEGGANVGAMFYNAENPVERYNMPDTLKCQHTARLTRGHALYSDMGRILCSIVEDTCGWHDPLSGHAPAATARDGFLIELAKHGLGRRDLVANVNFFGKVVVDDDGAMRYEQGNSKPESFVELRAEMNTLVILNTCPHPLAGGVYAPRPVQLMLQRVGPAEADDVVRTHCPENGRGFTLTERYFL